MAQGYTLAGEIYLSQRDLTNPSEGQPGQATAMLGRLATKKLEEGIVIMDILKMILIELNTAYSHADAKEKN